MTTTATSCPPDDFGMISNDLDKDVQFDCYASPGPWLRDDRHHLDVGRIPAESREGIGTYDVKTVFAKNPYLVITFEVRDTVFDAEGRPLMMKWQPTDTAALSYQEFEAKGKVFSYPEDMKRYGLHNDNEL